MTEPRPPARGLRFQHERWWWLVVFIVISLLIHLGLGWESRGWQILRDPAASLAPAAPGEIEVALGPPPATKSTITTKQEQATPAPRPSAPPTREAPSPEHNQRVSPVEAPQNPVRMDRPVSTVKTMKGQTVPLRNTEHIPQPTVSFPEPAPTPPPRPQPAVIPTPLPIAPPVGLPTAPFEPLAAEPKGGAATHDVGTVGPRPRALLPNSVVGPKATTDSGEADHPAPSGGAAGAATAASTASASNRIGLTRGIPFGSRTGLYGGSDQGDGLGPNGQPLGVSGGGRNGGEYHFHLGRPTAASQGLAPARIVYVLDVSGSMRDDNKITLARNALHQAVTELLPDDSFDFITFSDRPRNYSETLRPATTQNISAQETNVDLVEPNGDTDLSDAIDMALAMSGVTHIFLISDGEPTTGITDFDELKAHIRARNAGAAIHISTFALGDGEQFEGVQLLRQIAAENAGEYRYINDKGR